MPVEQFTCPYNPSHVMKITRAHQHVVNCRKANIHRNFIICSFNALHHYPPELEAKHLATCANRIALIDSSCVEYGMNSVVKGNLKMPPPAKIQFEREDWDSE